MSGGFWTGHLSGFDDHVRMTQVLDWVNGASWYDRTIERANPPEGFTTIWTRLVDIPTALVVWVAQNFTEQRTAAIIASVIVPFAELALLLPVARYFARPLVGKDKAWLIVLFLMFTTVLNYKIFSISGFHPGEASHHSWYIILDLALFGAAARMAVGVPNITPALIMGGVISLLLAVGIEGFPIIACVSAFLALLAWHFNRPRIAYRGMQALAMGAVGSLLLLPMHLPPHALLSKISFADPSILGPILMATHSIFFAFEFFILSKLAGKKVASFFSLGLFVVLLSILLISLFPQILDGPAAGLSPAERKMALSEHFEALPVYAIASDAVDFIGLMMPSFIALVAGWIAIRGSSNARRKAMMILYFAVTAMAAGFANIFSRFYHYAVTTACVWLLWSFERIKLRISKTQNFNLTALAVFILLGPFWMLLLPAISKNEPILSHVIFYPGKIQAMPDGCEMLPIADYINRHYDEDTLLSVVSWDTSRFLYHAKTRLDFIANYPSQDKFIDNANFFNSSNEAQVRDIALRHGIDLVALCRFPFYGNPNLPLEQQPMQVRMQLGQVPRWLKPVQLNMQTNYLLYEVNKEALRP